MRTDSYECGTCGGWTHDEQPVTDNIPTPEYCPYCGHYGLMWRSDSMYELVEWDRVTETSL